ncbi:tubulin-specific chaperone A-like [Argonauta hians]
MADPRIKQLRIKTGVVKRLAKEKVSYEKEAKADEEKMLKMKAEGKDEYDIKKQGEIFQESKSMIPDCLKRLKTAYEELTSFLSTESDLKSTELYTDAEKVCEQAKVELGLS